MVMSLTELAKLVQDMRRAQNDYFRHGRTPAQLTVSKDLERRVDDAVRSVLGGNAPDLFAEPKHG
jgi:hypothetical protein